MTDNNELSEIEIRSMNCNEGIYFSFKMIENVMLKLHDTCIKIEHQESIVFEALQLCWSFIDSVHRIREILQAHPRLKNKDRRLSVFLSKTEKTKDYRNYIQHLRKELRKFDYNKFPVWGSLSWVDKKNSMRCHYIILGTKIPGIKYSSCTIDKVEKRWNSNVSLSIFDLSYEFDTIYEELKDYMIHFEQWLDDNGYESSNKSFNLVINTFDIEFAQNNLHITHSKPKKN